MIHHIIVKYITVKFIRLHILQYNSIDYIFPVPNNALQCSKLMYGI